MPIGLPCAGTSGRSSTVTLWLLPSRTYGTRSIVRGERVASTATRGFAEERRGLADRQREEVPVDRVLLPEPPEPGGLPVPRPDGERLVEHEERRLERVDDALVVLVEAVELRRALLELGVRGAELGVDRLQLLDRGLELLVGRLQLLVGGLELLVGRLQLLVGGLELLVGRLQLLVGGGGLLGDPIELVAQPRELAHVLGGDEGPREAPAIVEERGDGHRKVEDVAGAAREGDRPDPRPGEGGLDLLDAGAKPLHPVADVEVAELLAERRVHRDVVELLRGRVPGDDGVERIDHHDGGLERLDHGLRAEPGQLLAARLPGQRRNGGWSAAIALPARSGGVTRWKIRHLKSRGTNRRERVSIDSDLPRKR